MASPQIDVVSDTLQLDSRQPAPPTKSSNIYSTPPQSPRKQGTLMCSPGTTKELNQPYQASPLERAIVCWINHHLLEDGEKQVVDLRTDLRDGLLLLSLVSILSHQPIIEPVHTSLPADKIKNMDLVLSMLEKDGLRMIHNDGASVKLVEGNMTFTLELCKSLIRHYHFTFGYTNTSETFMPASHKERLLLWLQVVLPDSAISDLTPQDWADGKHLSSLLSYFRNGDSSMSTSSNELSDLIHQAEIHLGIPSCLKPGDLAISDGKFVLMMYLYFFGRVGKARLLQWLNDLPPWGDSPIKNFHEGWAENHLHLVYQLVDCLIPNSLPSLDNLSTEKSASQITEVAVTTAQRKLHFSVHHPASALTSPISDPFPLILFLSQLQLLQRTHYDPALAANCRVTDYEAVAAVTDAALINTPIAFTVNCCDGGVGNLTAQVCSPDKEINYLPLQNSDGCYDVCFTPHLVGEHSFSVYWNNSFIPHFPLSINVFDPSLCRVEGKGLNRAVTMAVNEFKIITKGADLSHGTSPVSVKITSYQNEVLENEIVVLNEDTYRCRYCPPISVDGFKTYLNIDVSCNGNAVPGSPFRVSVLSSPASHCYLRSYPESDIIIHQPVTVVLDATNIANSVSKEFFEIEVLHADLQDKLPIDVSIDQIIPKEKNVFDVKFTPPTVGTYYFNVSCDGEAIPDSGKRFDVTSRAQIRDFPEAPCIVHQPITVILDANYNNASNETVEKKLIRADATGDDNEAMSVEIEPLLEEKNVFAVAFIPNKAGTYKLGIKFDKEVLPDCKFEVIKPSLANPQLSLQDFTHEESNCLVRMRLLARDGHLSGFKTMPPASSISSPLRDDGAPASRAEYRVAAVGKETGNALCPDFYQVQDGEFCIEIRTAVPDTYALYICYYGDLIACCPFAVDITVKVVSYDAVIPFQTGPSNFIELVLDTSEAQNTSTGDFSVQVFSNTTKSFLHATISEDSPNLFRVSFLPHQDDNYKIDVCWFCLPISSSPFSITFKQQTSRPPITVDFEPHLGARVSVSARLERAGNENKKPTEHLIGELRESLDAEQSGKQTDHDSAQAAEVFPMLEESLVVQQYKRGCYEIRILDSKEGKYFLHVYCLGREVRGSPFFVNLTGIPTVQPPNDKNIQEIQRPASMGAGILSASVQGQKVGPVPLTLAVTPEWDLAQITFEDRHRDIYDLQLYWNYVPFEGAPFSLTKHYESAVHATEKK